MQQLFFPREISPVYFEYPASSNLQPCPLLLKLNFQFYFWPPSVEIHSTESRTKKKIQKQDKIRREDETKLLEVQRTLYASRK